MKDPTTKKISESIDPADYNIRDPLDQDIRNYLVKNYNFIQCPLGKPELDKFCMSAYKNEEGTLVCMNMYGWTDHMQVDGLKKCLQDM